MLSRYGLNKWPQSQQDIDIGSSAKMDPHANTKLDRKHTAAMKSLLFIYLQMYIHIYIYIYIHEICLNSKAFRVHDNIYNIDNLTKTHFWHIVDITYNLFTYHRSCSGAKKNTKKLSLRHKNSHHFHKQDIFFLLTPKWDVYVSPNCRSGKRFENVLDASF